MSRIVRALLVWVMVIAMPVQGMAAATMLFCGPGHAPMMQEPGGGAPGGHAGHAGAPAHDHGAAGHAHAAIGESGAPQALAGADAPDLVAQHHGPYDCSACAACCMLLALPAGISLPPDLGRGHPALAPPSARIPSHQPDGLDRPPRALIA